MHGKRAGIPTAPPGWTFETPVIATSPATIGATPVEVTVTNWISRNLGSLTITKFFDPLGSGFTGDFTINYDCNDGTDHDGTVSLAQEKRRR